jgi:hypothetical protein
VIALHIRSHVCICAARRRTIIFLKTHHLCCFIYGYRIHKILIFHQNRYSHFREYVHFMFESFLRSRQLCSYSRTSSILWNPKVHYRVHKSPLPDPILSQINPSHTNPSYPRSVLILSTHLHLGLRSGLFPSGFPVNILHALIFSPFALHALPILSSLTWSF